MKDKHEKDGFNYNEEIFNYWALAAILKDEISHDNVSEMKESRIDPILLIFF